MVDCDAKEVKDDDLVKAFELALQSMAPLAEFINNLRNQIGVDKKPADELIWQTVYTEEETSLITEIKQMMLQHLDQYLFNTPKRVVHLFFPPVANGVDTVASVTRDGLRSDLATPGRKNNTKMIKVSVERNPFNIASSFAKIINVLLSGTDLPCLLLLCIS